jgi:hypothetical protein
MLTQLIAALLCVLAASGVGAAGNAPIVDLIAQPAQRADQKPAEVADIAKAFRAAGGALGWSFAEQGPEHLVATIVVRGKHSAVVDIQMRRGEYDLKYRNSVNLRFKEVDADDSGQPLVAMPHQPSLGSGKTVRTIHSSYHRWVSNLTKGVAGELLR